MTHDETPARFALLFDGRRDAYGTGEGRWVRERVTVDLYAQHLRGEGPGLGIAPMRDDGTVRWACIDLDQPDFELARTAASFLPGQSWIERSRSGNAHIWCFFSSPVEGWVPRGIMRSGLEALGHKDVEVNPKQDRLPEGGLGNYVNLPYYGDTRPMIEQAYASEAHSRNVTGSIETDGGFPLHVFLDLVRTNDPEDWRRRARSLGLQSPDERPDTAEFGTRDNVHECALHIYTHREDNPIRPGHRAKVLFALAKQLLNWRAITADRALELMLEVNAASPYAVPEREVRRIHGTVLTGRYTSTGCDDPLVRDYVRPDCPIRNET